MFVLLKNFSEVSEERNIYFLFFIEPYDRGGAPNDLIFFHT